MSLSASGNELNRATIETAITAGGLSQDDKRLAATEDREIVGYNVIDSGGTSAVRMEASFSSQSILNTSSDHSDATKSQTLFVSNNDETLYFGDDPINWDSGEEIHFHGMNNSASSERLVVVIYYREV